LISGLSVMAIYDKNLWLFHGYSRGDTGSLRLGHSSSRLVSTVNDDLSKIALF